MLELTRVLRDQLLGEEYQITTVELIGIDQLYSSLDLIWLVSWVRFGGRAKQHYYISY